MARATMEKVLNPEQLDEWFDATAEAQYNKDLLFSTVISQKKRQKVHGNIMPHHQRSMPLAKMI